MVSVTATLSILLLQPGQVPPEKSTERNGELNDCLATSAMDSQALGDGQLCKLEPTASFDRPPTCSVKVGLANLFDWAAHTLGASGVARWQPTSRPTSLINRQSLVFRFGISIDIPLYSDQAILEIDARWLHSCPRMAKDGSPSSPCRPLHI